MAIGKRKRNLIMLSTSFLGKNFSNPIVLASGILGLTAANLKRAVDNGCGGVTVKSVSKEARTGHPNPTMTSTEHFFINAVGLSNPSVAEGVKEFTKFKQMTDAPLIGSIFAGTPDEFAEVAEMICEAPIDFIEVNVLSKCQQRIWRPFAYSIPAVETITKSQSYIKSANYYKTHATGMECSRHCQSRGNAGADAICCNTISAW